MDGQAVVSARSFAWEHNLGLQYFLTCHSGLSSSYMRSNLGAGTASISRTKATCQPVFKGGGGGYISVNGANYSTHQFS